MKLDDDEVDLLRASYLLLSRDQNAATTLFYARLFEIAPDIRSRISGDLSEQGTKLLNMIGLMVARIHEFDDLAPMLVDLGERHGSYGASRTDFDAVEQALLALVAHHAPDEATARVWRTVFREMASIMQAAAASKAW